ncbi:MAG: RecX family transcriptional regulator [Chloroflexi bacterium]|nr:RecX family transcriptional regulator [Chloroflexota bacterium]
MTRITAIRPGISRNKRVNLFLDGRFAFSLEAEVAAKESLEVGQELDAAQAEALARSDRFHRCFDAAARYLSYRPRGEGELRGRLERRGFDAESVDAVIARLKEQGLVNDAAFAQFWADNRQAFRPRSRRLTGLELRQKGVASDIVDQVADTIDDADSAYRAALDRARSLSLSDYHSFRRRLGEYLRRRGFDYEVINDTVARIWQEREVGSR